jgi:hypothetical protein
MKVKVFQKIIEEAVAKAVRSELQAILSEGNKLNEIKSINFSSNDVNEVRNDLRNKMGSLFGLNTPNNEPQPNLSVSNDKNPYLDFIMDAANNMTPQEKSSLTRLDE